MPPNPSPTPSQTVTPQLCVFVQPYPSANAAVAPGGTAAFVVWVWTKAAGTKNVSVGASVTAASYLGTPAYTICPSASGATCKIASLPLGQIYELLVTVPVKTSAPLGARVGFTAKATASGAHPSSASATEIVAAASSLTLPSSTTVLPPLVALPPIPGTGVAPMNPSDLFPIVSPSPGTGSLGLPNARSKPALHVAEVGSTVPIDARLIGAQLLGLAVLAGAVTIAITRLSLRRRLPTPAPPAESGRASS